MREEVSPPGPGCHIIYKFRGGGQCGCSPPLTTAGAALFLPRGTAGFEGIGRIK